MLIRNKCKIKDVIIMANGNCLSVASVRVELFILSGHFLVCMSKS